jgi:lipoprotein signal peptidase
VDWIHVAGSRASFNLADLAIQLGAIGAVIAMLATRPGDRRTAEPSSRKPPEPVS